MITNCRKSGPQWTTNLIGKFDHKSLNDFRQANLPALTDPEIKTISVDMADLTYLDSSALGALLMLREKSLTMQKTVELVAARGDVKKVLDISNFNKLFVCR